jgi:hypothetical protein
MEAASMVLTYKFRLCQFRNKRNQIKLRFHYHLCNRVISFRGADSGTISIILGGMIPSRYYWMGMGKRKLKKFGVMSVREGVWGGMGL